MPPVKPRDMEDTWTPGELEKSLKGAKEDKKRHRDRDKDRDRKERHRDEDDKRRRPRDEDKRHRGRENGENVGDDKKSRRPKDEVDGNEKRHRRTKDENDDEERRKRREERRKKKEEEGHDGKERRQRHHDEDKDRERRQRHHDEDKDRDKKSRKDGDRNDRDRRRRHDDDEDRRHRKEEEGGDKRRRPRDRDEDESRRRRGLDRNGKDRERGHEERRHRTEGDDEKVKQHRDRDKKEGSEGPATTKKPKVKASPAGKTDVEKPRSTTRSRGKSSKKKEITAQSHVPKPSTPTSKNFNLPSHDISRKPHKVRETLETSHKSSVLPLRGSSQANKNTRKTVELRATGRREAWPVSSLKKYTPQQQGRKKFSESSQDGEQSTSGSGSFLITMESPLAGSTKEEEEKEKGSGGAKDTAEDEYNYDDDEFEDYEEDFEEDDEDEDVREDKVSVLFKARCENYSHNGDEQPSDQKKEKERENMTPRSVRDITSGYIRSRNWQGDDKSRGEMDEILRAMNAENERLLQESRSGDWDTPPSQSGEQQPTKRPATGTKAFINFVSAKQRQISSKASSKAKTRGRELLQIIELDRAVFDMFDMPPVGEYELYMRTFGRSDTKQVYIQTNEDNIEREIQTEEIETREKWCQYPAEDTIGCGGDEVKTEELESKPTDTATLTKFIQQAGQVMLILLEEDRAEAAQLDVDRKRSNICLSEAFLELDPPAFLQERCVSSTHFSSSQGHLLLTIYDTPKKVVSEDKLSSQGILTVWNINEPSLPQKILVSEGQPKCCCFSPVKPTLVFAGMADGSVAVWDLREENNLHKSLSLGEEDWILRYPTYNTAGVLHYENHQSGITSVVPILAPGDATELDDGDVEGATSFQLATVDEAAVVHLWVVAEISQPDPAGSESDLGLAPGGKVKLVKSSAITLENPVRDIRLRTSMKAFEMQLLPSDPSHFYVGTDTGHIIHGVRYGGKAPPRAYRPEIEAPVEVTSLDFSPFTEPVFLAGCGDGSIRLYHTKSAAPMFVWDATTEGQPILTVRWCRSRPSVFFVVDAASRLYIWDLLMSDAVPMKEETISQDRVTSFALSNDYTATGLGAPGRKPAMAVSFETGRVEVHTVSQQFSALMPEEVDQFAQFLGAAL